MHPSLPIGPAPAPASAAGDMRGDFRKFACRASAMNGSAMSMARKIARIFGTKTSVVSWICVSACSSDMATPTTRPTSIKGAETRTSVSIASRATSMTSDPVIGGSSDRHLQHIFVGCDHLVAHRHERLERGFGFGDRVTTSVMLASRLRASRYCRAGGSRNARWCLWRIPSRRRSRAADMAGAGALQGQRSCGQFALEIRRRQVLGLIIGVSALATFSARTCWRA